MTALLDRQTIRKPGPTAEESGHIASLDGIRGLAILLVLIFHFRLETRHVLEGGGLFAYLVEWVGIAGWCGVDLFFVLSGFVITGILWDSRADDRYYTNFYARRALRIFPLFYATLLVVTVFLPATGLAPDPTSSLGGARIWVWLYGSNFLVAHYGRFGFGHFWSLAVEEHFYLIWPAVVAALSRRALMVLCVLIFALSPAVRAVVSWKFGSLAVHQFTPCRLDGLATGAFLALAARGPGGLASLVSKARWAFLLAATAFVSIVLWRGWFTYHDRVVHVGGFSVLAVAFGALLIVVANSPASARVGRFFGFGGLTWLGKVSYGLYILHPLIRQTLLPFLPPDAIAAALHCPTRIGALVQLVLEIGLSLFAAWASWHFLESPILQLKRYFSERDRIEEKATLPNGMLIAQKARIASP
jgi:peptidoglycan/LPS O-acetylase OafA/YrhL